MCTELVYALTDDQSLTTLTHTPMTPTHVISNISSPISSDTLSLPSVPHSPALTNITTRNRSNSQSTATAQEFNPTQRPDVLFTISSSPPSGLPKLPDSETDAETDIAPPSSLVSPRLITIPPVQTPPFGRSSAPGSGPASASTSACQTPAVERDEDSPFGPLLPDTPRSSPGLYGARPFSPIVRVMGSASSLSSGSEVANGPPLSRPSRGLGSVGRRGSALAHELTLEGNQDTGANASGTLNTDKRFPVCDARGSDVDSSIASLSQRYPAPPTPPVLVSPPLSDGVRSLPSYSSPTSPASPSRPPQLGVSMLCVPTISRSRSRERSTEHSLALSSPTASFASFASPMSAARTVSMSEVSDSDAEFLSVAGTDADTDTDSDGDSDNESGSLGGAGVRISSTSSTGGASGSSAPVLVPDPFLDFEEVFEEGSDENSDGSWEIHTGYH